MDVKVGLVSSINHINLDMCKAINNISNQRHDSESTDDNVYSGYSLPKNLGGKGVGHPREI